MADSISFQYAVYLVPRRSTQNVDPLDALADVLKKFPGVKVVDEIPERSQAVLIHAYVETNVKEKLLPPGIRSLRYFGRGLTPDQARDLQSSDRALILNFGHPKEYVWTGLRTANAIVDKLAEKTNGLAWDEETREVFSPEAWHEKRVASWIDQVPDVSDETVIHIYNGDGSVRAITLGMSKMGLPDVTMDSTGWSSESQMGNLIDIFSQRLAEGAPIREPGEFKLDLRVVKNSHIREDQLKSLKGNASGVACLTLKPGKWEEGDPKNRLIQLGSDDYPGTDDSAKQEAMISSFFGSEDSISKIKHNEELLAASARAKAKLPELQKAFSSGLEPGEFIDVKAPFKTEDGGTEWMWVEVTSWRGGVIEGLLDNEPESVPELHAGAKVKVQQKDVFDYIRHFADKKTEGNTTGEIIHKMDEGQGGANPVAVRITVPDCGGD